MAPELAAATRPLNETVALDGSNVGATMSVRLSTSDGDERKEHRGHCCCINIYVNNNVQGATNSVLSSGSRVIVRESGVHLHLPHRRPGSTRKTQKHPRQGLERLMKRLCCNLSALLAVVAFLVLVCFVVSRCTLDNP